MGNDLLLDHLADIISAHVSNNSVSADDLPAMIRSVYASLATLAQDPEPAPEKLSPAVPVRSAVRPDAIACLECGAKFKTLKRHLGVDHGLTPAEYRQRWNLPDKYPMVAADYAAMRGELAKKLGLGRRSAVQAPAKVAATSGARAGVTTTSKTAAASKPRKKLGIAFNAIAALAAAAENAV